MRQGLIAMLLLVAAFCIQGYAAAETPSDIKELKQAKVQTAREALQALDVQLKAGRVAPFDSAFATWTKRLLDAELALCENKADRLAAHEKYLKYVKELEGFVNEQFKARTCSIVNLKEAQYRRLEAELWLAEAKTK